MALYRFLQNVIDEGVPFTPEDVAQLGAVYEAMLVVLRLEDRADPITEIVAKKIIEIFRSGERDSAQICHRAIKELGIPNLD